MKPFVIIAVLLIASGAYLLVAGVLRVDRCLEAGVFSLGVWRPEFWLLVPGEAGRGLGPNAGWFIRLGGGLALIMAGRLMLRVSQSGEELR